MTRFLTTLLAVVSLAWAGHASSQITGTLSVTNAANIVATNGYTITVEGDTRTLTNSVVDVETQILVSTNNATMVQRILAQFAAYPVSGLALLSDGSTYVSWRQAVDTALAITLNTNTWGRVSYLTNTTTTNVLVVRVPHTAESAANQTNIANGLSAYLNSAPNTTGISASKLLSGTVPLARITGLTSNELSVALYDWIDGQSGLQTADLDTSAELRALLGDESGTGAALFAGGNIGAATATTPAADDNDTSVPTTAFVQTELADAISDTAFASSWNGVTAAAATKNAVYDWAHLFDTDDDGKVNVLDLGAGIPKTDASGVLSLASAGTDYLAPSAIDNTAYDASSWNGDTTHAPSKDAVRDKIEALVLGGGLGSGDIDTSAELRAIIGDESGTGAALFAGGDIAAATATTPSADDSDTSVATTAFVQGELNGLERIYEFALSDETTAITTGTAKLTWRAPHAMTITAVRASLSTTSSSGNPTVDINEAGSTILSTKLSIDSSEKTSTTAATAAVISDSSIADDSEITFDIDTAGTGAKGLKVKIYYTR